MKQAKALVSQTRGGGGWKLRILTLLTASFILLSSSLTFSSCKDCGKKETKPDRNDKTSDAGLDTKTATGKVPIPEEKEKELGAKVSRELAKAAKAAVAAWRAAQVANPINRKGKTERKAKAVEAVDRAKEACVAAEATKDARTLTDPKIQGGAKAIELLAKFATWQAKFAAKWNDIEWNGTIVSGAEVNAAREAFFKAFFDMEDSNSDILNIFNDACKKEGIDDSNDKWKETLLRKAT